METRLQRRKNEMQEEKEYYSDGFEERISKTLVEIKGFIVKTEQETNEFKEQLNGLFVVLESQSLSLPLIDCRILMTTGFMNKRIV